MSWDLLGSAGIHWDRPRGHWDPLELMDPLDTPGIHQEIYWDPLGSAWRPRDLPGSLGILLGSAQDPMELAWRPLGSAGICLETPGMNWDPPGSTRRPLGSAGIHWDHPGDPWDPLGSTGILLGSAWVNPGTDGIGL
ncbi:hypothetical protein WISP_00563 [Willisornis vidua]|uniref:Uncharacterized protein n=1 Tax=Willisornis vidua TaxID=1566151 RepID=A0ABQ9E1T5_9PASS|nr:hypothetical protein WISP_00563 [Willisornis vidua]